MIDQAFVARAKSLAVEDRWKQVNELWESIEDEDFPISSEVGTLLRERRAEYAGLPLEGPTLAEITADWRRDQQR
ncbi:MAG: hypothetical protein ACRDNS_16080 [Trebonia sp.]